MARVLHAMQPLLLLGQDCFDDTTLEIGTWVTRRRNRDELVDDWLCNCCGLSTLTAAGTLSVGSSRSLAGTIISCDDSLDAYRQPRHRDDPRGLGCVYSVAARRMINLVSAVTVSVQTVVRSVADERMVA